MDPLETPFNAMIVGMTACGKTHYLLEMLERDYMGHFDYIVLLCPTFEWNKTYREWKYIHDPDVIAIPFSSENVDKVIRLVMKTYTGTNTLIILDDCASGQTIKNRSGQVVNVGFHARHYGFSSIIITQQLTSVSKPYRQNIARLVSFYTASRRDMAAITDDYMAGVDDQEIKDIAEILKHNEYSKLVVNLRPPHAHVVE